MVVGSRVVSSEFGGLGLFWGELVVVVVMVVSRRRVGSNCLG